MSTVFEESWGPRLPERELEKEAIPLARYEHELRLEEDRLVVVSSNRYQVLDELRTPE